MGPKTTKIFINPEEKKNQNLQQTSNAGTHAHPAANQAATARPRARATVTAVNPSAAMTPTAMSLPPTTALGSEP